MKGSDSLKTEDKWLLSIMSVFQHIEGRTRLQKLGMISFHEILNDGEFFDDWMPQKYGGFSPRQAASLKSLEESGHVVSSKTSTTRGTVDRYSITEKGRRSIDIFLAANAAKIEDLKQILSYYNSCTLKDLLNTTYKKYPRLAANSTIIADVNKAADLDLHSMLESEDRLGSEPPEMASPYIPPPASQHVLGDMDFREELAKSIGLDRVPDLDPQSFERIKGIWSKRMGKEPFDVVKAVREVRNW